MATRRSCNIKKYMFNQKDNDDLVVVPVRNTRLHDATVFKTERPIIEKYKSNPLHRGTIIWNSLSPDIRNIKKYESFKSYF